MLGPVLALTAVGLAISLPVTALLVRLGRRLGALDTPGAPGHEKVVRDVPNVGGVAIYLALVLPLAVFLAAFVMVDESAWQKLLPGLAPHRGRIAGTAPTAWALLGGLTAMFALGLIDDRRGLGPVVKLLVQVAAASVLAVWFDVRLLELLDPLLGGEGLALGHAPSIVATVLWIVVVTNAINFLDNMDGLAAGVSALAAALLMAATIINEQWFIAGTLALLVGALAGFLRYNFPPARIFMGDGGSLVIGFLLGVLTARTTYLHPALGGGTYGVLMPLVILAIPLYDLATVTVIRLRQGRSPFVGDQQHFSHRLVQRGLSPRGAVVVIWCATLVTGIGGVGLGQLSAWQAGLVGVQTAAVLVMIVLFEHASRHAVGGRHLGEEERR